MSLSLTDFLSPAAIAQASAEFQKAKDYTEAFQKALLIEHYGKPSKK